MKRQTRAQATRRHLIGAAARIIQLGGTEALTLEAVAREAGVSKGGLLYHFPSKAELVAGMVAQLADQFDAAVAREAQADSGPEVGRWTRAYIRASFAPPEGELEEEALSAALLAGAAANPELLAPLRERYADWQRRAEADGLGPEVGTAIRLALDGLWAAELFGLAPPRGDARERLRDWLLALAGDRRDQETRRPGAQETG